MEITPFQSNLIIPAIAAVLGAILTFIVQRFLNKRGTFTYYVWHNRVGISADDSVFGTVRVTWNNSEVANLYSSTVELRNESLNDYENVTVRVFTNDTILLTERTEIVGTTHYLAWSQAYADKLAVQTGSQASVAQRDLYSSQREYEIPTFNRGQLIRFTFLNSAKTENQPSLWLDIVHKGVKTKFQIAQNKFMGVQQNTAALVGSILGIFLLVAVVIMLDVVWIAAIVSFLYGLFVLVPGALLIKLWQKLRNYFGG